MPSHYGRHSNVHGIGGLEGGGRIFEQACKLCHEGTVAKRRDLAYESGRSKRWLKFKNLAAGNEVR